MTKRQRRDVTCAGRCLLSGGFKSGWFPGVAVEQVAEGVELVMPDLAAVDRQGSTMAKSASPSRLRSPAAGSADSCSAEAGQERQAQLAMITIQPINNAPRRVTR